MRCQLPSRDDAVLARREYCDRRVTWHPTHLSDASHLTDLSHLTHLCDATHLTHLSDATHLTHLCYLTDDMRHSSRPGLTRDRR
jgi:hypothetical protein